MEDNAIVLEAWQVPLVRMRDGIPGVPPNPWRNR